MTTDTEKKVLIGFFVIAVLLLFIKKFIIKEKDKKSSDNNSKNIKKANDVKEQVEENARAQNQSSTDAVNQAIIDMNIIDELQNKANITDINLTNAISIVKNNLGGNASNNINNVEKAIMAKAEAKSDLVIAVNTAVQSVNDAASQTVQNTISQGIAIEAAITANNAEDTKKMIETQKAMAENITKAAADKNAKVAAMADEVVRTIAEANAKQNEENIIERIINKYTAGETLSNEEQQIFNNLPAYERNLYLTARNMVIAKAAKAAKAAEDAAAKSKATVEAQQAANEKAAAAVAAANTVDGITNDLDKAKSEVNRLKRIHDNAIIDYNNALKQVEDIESEKSSNPALIFVSLNSMPGYVVANSVLIFAESHKVRTSEELIKAGAIVKELDIKLKNAINKANADNEAIRKALDEL